VATVPILFQIKLRVPPVPRIWGPVRNAIQNLISYQIPLPLGLVFCLCLLELANS